MDPVTNQNLAALPISSTPLEDLVGEMFAKVEPQVFPIDVPNRPGFQILVLPKLEDKMQKRWKTSAFDKSWRPGQPDSLSIDSIALAANVVADTTVGLLYNGERVMDPDGLPVTFASAALRKNLPPGMSNADVAKQFFANPAHLQAAAEQISTEAEKAVTPSKGSSTS